MMRIDSFLPWTHATQGYAVVVGHQGFVIEGRLTIMGAITWYLTEFNGNEEGFKVRHFWGQFPSLDAAVEKAESLVDPLVALSVEGA